MFLMYLMWSNNQFPVRFGKEIWYEKFLIGRPRTACNECRVTVYKLFYDGELPGCGSNLQNTVGAGVTNDRDIGYADAFEQIL